MIPRKAIAGHILKLDEIRVTAHRRATVRASHPAVPGSILGVPKFFQSKNLLLLKFIDISTAYRVDSAKSIIVDQTHLVLVRY